VQSNNIRCALLADQEAAAGDGTAAPGIQQASDLGTPVISGDAARPQTSYRVAPKDVQSVWPHSKNANMNTWSGWQ